mgnify:CR=1 FL=1
MAHQETSSTTNKRSVAAAFPEHGLFEWAPRGPYTRARAPIRVTGGDRERDWTASSLSGLAPFRVAAALAGCTAPALFLVARSTLDRESVLLAQAVPALTGHRGSVRPSLDSRSPHHPKERTKENTLLNIDPDLLTEREAGEALGLSRSTLRNRRLAGTGGPYVMIGKHACYRRDELELNEHRGVGGRPPVGDVPGYAAAHSRVVARYGKASKHACAHCGDPATDWALVGGDLIEPEGRANAGMRYSLDPDDYVALCRANGCHAAYDAANAGRRKVTA